MKTNKKNVPQFKDEIIWGQYGIKGQTAVKKSSIIGAKIYQKYEQYGFFNNKKRKISEMYFVDLLTDCGITFHNYEFYSHNEARKFVEKVLNCKENQNV